MLHIIEHYAYSSLATSLALHTLATIKQYFDLSDLEALKQFVTDKLTESIEPIEFLNKG